jgi:KDO2-lipid IV(A) lauroyltransferase
MRSIIAFVLKIFAVFLSLWPRSWVRACGGALGFLWIDFFKFRRKIVLDNLDIAFPEWSPEKKLEVGRKSVYFLGYNFAEFFMIPAMNERWLRRNVVFEGVDNLIKAREKKKGVYFLTLHLGNGDMGANAIAMRFCDVYLITKRFKNKLFNDIWFSIRGAQGVHYIDAHGPSNAFDILKALKKNAGLVFVVDQYMGKPYGIATRFFGKRTGTAYGLALFAQKTKSPVVPVYTFEGEDGKMHIVFEPEMDLQPFIVEDKSQSLLNITQHFCDKVEEIIRRHPEQWLWVHRRWKNFD